MIPAMRLPTVYIPITPRGTVAFDVDGDPVVFTKPWLAIKAACADESVMAFELVLVPRVAPVAVDAATSPYAD